MSKNSFVGMGILFGAITLMLYFTVGCVNLMDEEINETNLSAPIHGAYNITTTGTEVGFTLGSILPILTAVAALIALCLFLGRRIW